MNTHTWSRYITLAAAVTTVGLATTPSLARSLDADADGKRTTVRFELSGACPGPAELIASGATPGAPVRLLGGFAEGTTIVPSGPCAGTEIGLDDATTLLVGIAEPDGTKRTLRELPETWCGAHLQLLDEARCEVSDVVPVPDRQNLLENGDAETGDLTGWVDVIGNGYDLATDANIEIQQGEFSFWGGEGGSGPQTNELQQEVDVSDLAAPIDAGSCRAFISGWRRSGSNGVQTDPANVILDFLDADRVEVDSFQLGDLLQPGNTWVPFSESLPIAPGVRALRYRMISSRTGGGSTDAYHDSQALSVACAPDA